ncbi:MAG TPA: carbonic anhydrase [Ktedonobacteraceae bacterium]|jgi:carbonic anhydrase|nr:carbonic anhydrase [Ktedonobacteraceae bacterium]
MLEEILQHNERFLQQPTPAHVGHAPSKHTAVVTCMDCRLVRLFEDALGLQRGDVLELRTAGATISQPERAHANNDLIRSLAGGVYLLGVREVLVIGHTNCGLSRSDPDALIASMRQLNVDPYKLIEQEQLGDINGLVRWLGTFENVQSNVCEVVEVIRHSPYLPSGLPVHGLVIDIDSGRLSVVYRDNRSLDEPGPAGVVPCEGRPPMLH